MAKKSCAYPGCNNSYTTHSWGAIKAYDAGWFQQKDGRSWCPNHIPDWVVAWQSRQTHQNATERAVKDLEELFSMGKRDDGWPAEDPEERDQR